MWVGFGGLAVGFGCGGLAEGVLLCTAFWSSC